MSRTLSPCPCSESPIFAPISVCGVAVTAAPNWLICAQPLIPLGMISARPESICMFAVGCPSRYVIPGMAAGTTGRPARRRVGRPGGRRFQRTSGPACGCRQRQRHPPARSGDEPAMRPRGGRRLRRWVGPRAGPGQRQAGLDRSLRWPSRSGGRPAHRSRGGQGSSRKGGYRSVARVSA